MVTTAISEYSLENQLPMQTEFPRALLTPERCLLCDKKRGKSDDPQCFGGSDIPPESFLLNSLCWVCSECKKSMQDEDALFTGEDASSQILADILTQSSRPQDLFDLSSSIQSEHNEEADDEEPSGSSGSFSGPTCTGDADCNCVWCRTHLEIRLEEEKTVTELQKNWNELKDIVRRVYRETGANSRLRDQIPQHYRLKDIVSRLCQRDSHLLYKRLEAQATDYVIEIKVRVLKKLTSGPSPRTPSFCHDFIECLLKEYNQINNASSHISDFIKPLETGHLVIFKVTWQLHNKNLFRSICWDEPMVKSSIESIIEGLNDGCNGCPIYPCEQYNKIYKEYIKFTEEMTVIAAVWRECQHLIDSYQERLRQNKLRSRNIFNEISTFNRDKTLWQSKIGKLGSNMGFMDLYSSLTHEIPPVLHCHPDDEEDEDHENFNPDGESGQTFGMNGLRKTALFEEPKPPSIPNSDSESDDNEECPKIFSRPELRTDGKLIDFSEEYDCLSNCCSMVSDHGYNKENSERMESKSEDDVKMPSFENDCDCDNCVETAIQNTPLPPEDEAALAAASSAEDQGTLQFSLSEREEPLGSSGDSSPSKGVPEGKANKGSTVKPTPDPCECPVCCARGGMYSDDMWDLPEVPKVMSLPPPPATLPPPMLHPHLYGSSESGSEHASSSHADGVTTSSGLSYDFLRDKMDAGLEEMTALLTKFCGDLPLPSSESTITGSRGAGSKRAEGGGSGGVFGNPTSTQILTKSLQDYMMELAHQQSLKFSFSDAEKAKSFEAETLKSHPAGASSSRTTKSTNRDSKPQSSGSSSDDTKTQVEYSEDSRTEVRTKTTTSTDVSGGRTWTCLRSETVTVQHRTPPAGASAPTPTATCSAKSRSAAQEPEVSTSSSNCSAANDAKAAKSKLSRDLFVRNYSKLNREDCGRPRLPANPPPIPPPTCSAVPDPVTTAGSCNAGADGGSDADEQASQHSQVSTTDSTNSSGGTSGCGGGKMDCCYCEVFGHGHGQIAPPRRAEEMKDRLRKKLAINRDLKCGESCAKRHLNRPTTQSPQGKAPPPPVAATHGDAATSSDSPKPQPKPAVPDTKKQPSPPSVQPPDISQMDIDEIAAYIKGTPPKKPSKKAKRKNKKNSVDSMQVNSGSSENKEVSEKCASSDLSVEHPSTSSDCSVLKELNEQLVSTQDASLDSPRTDAKSAKKKKKKSKTSSGSDFAKKPMLTNIDSEEVFKPRADLDNLDDGEKEIELFKKFCMDSAQPRERKKISLNMNAILK